MRPLFPEGYLTETADYRDGVVADPEHDPGILGIVGAGASAGDIRYSVPPPGERRACRNR